MLIALKLLEIETWWNKRKVRDKTAPSDGIIRFDLEGIFQYQISKLRKFHNFEGQVNNIQIGQI